MKRRLFLRSLWAQGLALPAAYCLIPGQALLAKPSSQGDAGSSDMASANTIQGNGGISSAGRGHGFVARDFHNPWLELIRLLKEVSEIEHSLMIQYIYAAYSLKPKYQSIVGSATPDGSGLMSIVIQEMQHLAAVNKLLVALGSSPNLMIQDLPYEPDLYPFPMSLEPLTRQSVARYVYVEGDEKNTSTDIGADLPDQDFRNKLARELGSGAGINHVPRLYNIVLKLMSSMIEEGTLGLADHAAWINELKHIMLQGEKIHFKFFRELFLAEHEAFSAHSNVWDLPPGHPDYPSFPIVANPSAYVGHENQIADPEVRELAWLSNLHYWIQLMLLDQYYRTGEESFNALAQQHMVGPLHSLAVELTGLGFGLPFDRLSLGYSAGADKKESLLLIGAFLGEAELVTNKLKKDLPATYMFEVIQATEELISSELRQI